MVNDRGIVYFCKKTILLHDKKCTASRIRIEQGENNLLLTLQALFAIKFIEWEDGKLNYKSADKNKLISERDNVKNQMNLLFDQLTKLGLGEDIFKSKLAEHAKKLKELEEKILEVEVLEKNNDETQKQVLFDKLRKINYTEALLDEDSYSSLLRETVKEIIVYDEKLKIVLVDGVSFELPRIQLKRRAKGVPFSSALMFFAPETPGAQITNSRNVIQFYDTTKENPQPKTLIENRLYWIWLWE